MSECIKKVRRRDGTIVDFDERKIYGAILETPSLSYELLAPHIHGHLDVNSFRNEVVNELLDEVVRILEQRFTEKIPTLNNVHNVVKEVLVRHNIQQYPPHLVRLPKGVYFDGRFRRRGRAGYTWSGNVWKDAYALAADGGKILRDVMFSRWYRRWGREWEEWEGWKEWGRKQAENWESIFLQRVERAYADFCKAGGEHLKVAELEAIGELYRWGPGCPPKGKTIPDELVSKGFVTKQVKKIRKNLIFAEYKTSYSLTYNGKFIARYLKLSGGDLRR